MARLLARRFGCIQLGAGKFLPLWSVPVVILYSGSVALGNNDAFRDDVMGGRDVCLLPMSKVVRRSCRAWRKKRRGPEHRVRRPGGRYSVLRQRRGGGRRPVRGPICQQYHAKRRREVSLPHAPGDDSLPWILRRVPQGIESRAAGARVAGEYDLALEQFIGAPQAVCGASGFADIAVVESGAICRRSLKKLFHPG